MPLTLDLREEYTNQAGVDALDALHTGSSTKSRNQSFKMDLPLHQDDCKVSSNPLMVSLSNHRRIERASFDKLRMRRHQWAALLCNRPAPYTSSPDMEPTTDSLLSGDGLGEAGGHQLGESLALGLFDLVGLKQRL